MIELRMVQGNRPGTRWTAPRFPVRIGRRANSDVVLDDPGVWEDHLELDYEEEMGLVARPLSDGAVLIDDRPAEEVPLRHGSTLRLGAALLQFWLAPVSQRPFPLLEGALWAGLLLLCAGEVALIVQLSR